MPSSNYQWCLQRNLTNLTGQQTNEPSQARTTIAEMANSSAAKDKQTKAKVGAGETAVQLLRTFTALAED